MVKKQTKLIRAATCTAALWWLPPAFAGSIADPQTSPDNVEVALAEGVPAKASAQSGGLWERPNLMGTMGGLRTALDNYGITLGLQETSEYLGNVSGGIKRGFAYTGATLLTVGVDGEKALGWPGATFFASGLQIHGRSTSLTQGNLGAVQTVSSIEANPATRLWELWYEQSFANGRADVKIGQQAVDQEFLVSQYGAPFVSAMFGWPALPSADLPGGGPAYPLASLGVRLRVKASDSLTFLGGVFDGNPAGQGEGDAQKLNRTGTTFNLRDSALFIAELQYEVNASSADSAAQPSGGLPGTYKIGAWYHSGQFADQRFDTHGVSLANPGSNGLARQHRGDYSLYALADQMVWRASPDSPRSIGVFARAMGAPGDRNVIDFSATAGVTMKAPFKGREHDTVALGVGYAKIGNRARGFDRDTTFYSNAGFPVRSSEAFVEATYQYQIAPWWWLQGDFQYMINPGGGVENLDKPGEKIRNEAIFGLRTTIVF